MSGYWEPGNESSEMFLLAEELEASRDGRCFMNLDTFWYF